MHNLRFQPILYTWALKLMANRGEIWTQAPCSRPTALITVLCYTLKELPPSLIPGKAVILNFYTANESSPPLIMGGLVSPYCIRVKVIPICLCRCSSFATEAQFADVHCAIGEVWQKVAILLSVRMIHKLTMLKGTYAATTTSLRIKKQFVSFCITCTLLPRKFRPNFISEEWSVTGHHLFHYDLFVQGMQSALSQSNPVIFTVGLDALLLRKEK